MRKEYWRIVILGGGFCSFVIAMQVRPFLSFKICLLIFLGGLCVQLIASLVGVLVRWRKGPSWSAVLPFAIGMAFLLTAPLDQNIGFFVADWEFKQHLPEYNKIIDDLKTGVIPCNSTFTQITIQSMPSNLKDIKAARQSDGEVVVLFLVGTAFPPYHTGYIYNGCIDDSNCLAEFSALDTKFDLRKMIKGWYHFSG